jgi:hypothetical protein
MGREATCTCEWNGKKCTVKALVEPPELILRGELRRRVPIAKMQSIKAECDQLRFTCGWRFRRALARRRSRGEVG